MTTGDASAPLPPAAGADGFGSTAWSLVLAASRDDRTGPALDRLCRLYWKPIYTFARRTGQSPADAEDVTQEFFAYLLDREWLQQADPGRGSFRAFLLTLFQNFLANYRRRQRAQKRGGGAIGISFQTEEGESELGVLAALNLDPAATFDHVWANCVLQTTLQRLESEQNSSGKDGVFKKLRPFLTQRPAAGDYEKIGRELGLPRNQVALQIHRLSRRFAELVRQEVAETLAQRGDVEQELRYLLKSLDHG